MAAGDIGPVLGTGIFDAIIGNEPSVTHISGDVYAVAYRGQGNHGWLRTLTIDNTGSITILPHTLEFDNVSGYSPRLIHVSGDVYAIAYWNATLDDGIVKTVSIDNIGTIGAVATFTFDAVRGWVPDIIHIFGDVFAIAYRGPGDDGWLITLTISNDGTIIALTGSSLEFDGTYCSDPKIIHVSGDVYAVAYKSALVGDTEICTMTIDNAGVIGAVIDRYQGWGAPPSDAMNAKIIHISGNVFAAVSSEGLTLHGWVTTFIINNDGSICPAPPCFYIDKLEFDATQGTRPDIIHISRDIFAIAYEGPDQDGFLITLTIANNGTIGAIIGTLEFDDVGTIYPHIIHIGDVYAIAYNRVPVQGTVKTMDIQTFTIPTVITDPATSVINNAASLNGTLSDDGGEACDCGFEWGEASGPPYDNIITLPGTYITGQSFSQTLYPLKPNTTYYFRTFATNSQGTTYGTERSFTTTQVPYYDSLIFPKVQTNPATLITEHTARLNGVVVEDGGAIGAVRFQWGLTTEYGNNTPWLRGYGKGDEFFADLDNLAEGEAFHFRAQFQNSKGIFNGNDKAFWTLTPLGPVTLVTDEIIQLLEGVA